MSESLSELLLMILHMVCSTEYKIQQNCGGQIQ